TLLIERALLATVGPLDTDLPIFEDWDLLIRLSAHAAFHHLARVTCEYRLFREPGHHALGERAREQRDFLTVKARVIGKHRGRLTAEVTARVIDRLRAETVAEGETVGRLRREIDGRSREADALRRDVDALGREVLAMQATRAWRLAERWRALRR